MIRVVAWRANDHSKAPRDSGRWRRLPNRNGGLQAGELPAEVMAFSKLVLFSNEQAQKCAAYISEAGECEIAGRNEELLRDKFSLVEIN